MARHELSPSSVALMGCSNVNYTSAKKAKAPFEMKSPNSRLSAYIRQNKALIFTVKKDGETVIRDSFMGLQVGRLNICSNVLVAAPKVDYKNEVYQTRGVSSWLKDEYNLYEYPVKHMTTGFEYKLQIKLFNDGFAFRFVFSKNSNLLIEKELTTFRMPLDSVCWYQTDTVKLQGKTTSCETRYVPDNTLAAALITFQLANNKGFVMLTEADVYNYPGCAFRHRGAGEFSVDLWDSGAFAFEQGTTPWRLALICDDLNSLVNCGVIKNASQPEHEIFENNKEWIRPGKSIWSYYIDKEHRLDYDRILKYNDYAAQLNYPYTLVDHGWRSWALSELGAFKKLEEVCRDAKSRGVDVWVWKASTMGLWFAPYRRWFLAKCKAIGAAGVKIDFNESETTLWMNYYRDCLYEAAKLGLMIIYHNPNKPTGLSRTFPNLMSMEAIRGLQGVCDADDNTILPFTRCVAGDADYTPFCTQNPKMRGNCTWAHMLANTVIFASSFMTIADDPEFLKTFVAADFLKDLPTHWDETIVLPQSKIGKLAVFARRSGSKWYVAAQNSSRGEKELKIKLAFLEKGKSYTAQIFSDDQGGVSIKKEVKTYKSSSTMAASLLCGGGFAAVFEQKEG